MAPSLMQLVHRVSASDTVDAIAATLPALSEALSARTTIYSFDATGHIRNEASTIAQSFSYRPELFASDPLQLHPLSLPPAARVIRVSEVVDRRDVERSSAYDEFYQPLGFEQLMSAWLTPTRYAAPGMCGMLFVRDDRRHRFSVDDERFMQELLPIYAAAWRRAQQGRRLDARLDALQALIEARSANVTLLLDADGELLWLSPSATRWLSEAPAEIKQAAKALLTGSVSQPTVLQLHGGATASFQLQLLQGESGRPSVFVELFIERHGEHVALTAREASVLRLIETGLSNPDVALALGVSLETVRTHVKAIYRKRKVSSRTELLALRRIS